MICESTTELVEYTTASHMARVFNLAMERYRELHLELLKVNEMLFDAFSDSGCGRHTWQRLGFNLTDGCPHHHVTEFEQMMKLQKLYAWSVLIEKTGIRKVMSSKRQEQLNKLIHSNVPSSADDLPEISEETIMAVLQGYCQSAEEFLHEAIREEYDFWKPYAKSDYKTNQKSVESAKLERKLIKPYMVEYTGHRGWYLSYDRKPHVQAIDNIMHILDGKGTIKGYSGPLCEAIESTKGTPGSGETDYFKFRLFENKNIHLTFKREDLLDKFNAICGRAWLGNK